MSRGQGRWEGGRVKSVVVDVDGTLADDSRRIGLDAVAALRKVDDSGVPVMLASGNVLPIAYALANYLGFSGPIIAENGGIVSHRQRVWTLGDPRKPKGAYEHLRTRMDVERLFTDRWRETEVGLRRDADLAEVREMLRDHDVDVQTTGWAIHIMERGMDKFRGVERACELLEISVEDVAAIGDSENDEMMLRECGVGIAVANASAEGKRAADHVTRASHGEGVIEALDWLGLLG